MIKGQKVKENNMSNYVISCCSTADLTREHMLERNIKYACFHYELDGKEYMDDLGQSMPLPDFYKAMEAGAMTKTSQINQEEYMEYFRQFLDEGYDVLHCTLSSGISGTVNSARLAKEALEEEYPDRKIYRPYPNNRHHPCRVPASSQASPLLPSFWCGFSHAQ